MKYLIENANLFKESLVMEVNLFLVIEHGSFHLLYRMRLEKIFLINII